MREPSELNAHLKSLNGHAPVPRFELDPRWRFIECCDCRDTFAVRADGPDLSRRFVRCCLCAERLWRKHPSRRRRWFV